MPSNHLILYRPLLLSPSIFASIRVFSNKSVLRIQWPKYWSFSFSISPSNEYSGLISVRMDWLDLLAVQGTLKSLLQHHSSKASILQLSAVFTVQLSHPSVQFSSVAQLCPTVASPWIATRQASLSITNSQSSPKLMCVELDHIHTWLLKNIALTRWTFVGKVTSLLFNMLSRLVITFLPKSKRLFISWLQSPFAVILEPKK